VLAALVVAACGSNSKSSAGPNSGSSGNAPKGDPVVIGVVLSLTGPAASIGQSTLAGINVEVDRINAQGGMLGRPVKIETRDDGSDAQKAGLAGRELLNLPNIVAIVPSDLSTNALAILPLATEKKVLSVTPAVAPDVFDTSKFPYSFSITFPSKANTDAVLHLAKKEGKKAIGIVSTDDAAGHDFVNKVNDLAGSQGLNVVGSEVFSNTAKDVTAQLQQLRDKKADALVAYAPGTAIGVLMKGLENLAWDVDVLGTVATITGDVSKLVPSSVASQLKAVTSRVAARTSEKPPASVQEIIDAISKQPKVTSMVNAATGVDAIAAMNYAFKTAGSFDGPAATKAMEGMKGDSSIKPGTFFTYPSGPAFDATNHSPTNASFDTGFWAVVHVSDLVNGTLEGENFDY
jgi:branched-chain amino acid transport system substrate-binding protein